MIPYICQVGGDNAVGDCMRACVASILEIEPDKVPHFFEDDPDGPTGHARIKEFLAPRGLTSFTFSFDGSHSFEEFCAQTSNIDGHYILLGRINIDELAGHAVVACAGKIVHDPAWVKKPFVAPLTDGVHNQWQIMIIGVK